MTDWRSLYASRVARIQSSDVREQARLMGQADIISFGGGIPDPAVFPHEEIAEAAHRILIDPAKARVALQYSESGGWRPLREWLVGYMASLGLACGPDNILITSGSQQGLDLIGRLLLSPGDRVLAEAPTYIGALRAFDACEASYGTVDETNSAIGVVLGNAGVPAEIRRVLTEVQHDLFDLGGELCIPGHVMINASHVDRLEKELDALNDDLPPLKEFILPGGGPAAAACHLARAICRRAERRCWSLARVESVSPEALKYLNRLSDLLFVMARVLARAAEGEVVWRRAALPKS